LKNLLLKSGFSSVVADHPIAFFDVGARGGFDADLWPIAFGVDAYGFEPNSREFDRLVQEAPGPWKSVQYFPHAIGDSDGRRTLHIPSDPQAASLLAPKENLSSRYDRDSFFKIEKMAEVETLTLDHVLEKYDLPAPEMLKIDIEGLELASLKSSPNMMEGLLAVKVEVAYVQVRDAQPVAWEIEAFMHQCGFMLMDLTGASRWRTSGHVVHPHMSKEQIPYSRGQLIHGDYLFFRDPSTSKLSSIQLLKLGLLSISYGFFDLAQEMFSDDRTLELSGLGDERKLLIALESCSRRYGRVVARREFFHHLRLLGPYFRRFPDLLLR